MPYSTLACLPLNASAHSPPAAELKCAGGVGNRNCVPETVPERGVDVRAASGCKQRIGSRCLVVLYTHHRPRSRQCVSRVSATYLPVGFDKFISADAADANFSSHSQLPAARMETLNAPRRAAGLRAITASCHQHGAYSSGQLLAPLHRTARRIRKGEAAHKQRGRCVDAPEPGTGPSASWCACRRPITPSGTVSQECYTLLKVAPPHPRQRSTVVAGYCNESTRPYSTQVL